MTNSSRLIPLLILIAMQNGCGGGGSGDSSTGQSSTQPLSPSSISFSKHYDYQQSLMLPYPSGWTRDTDFQDTSVIASFAEPLASTSDKVQEAVLVVKVGSTSDVTGSDVTNVKRISSAARSIAGFMGQEEIFDADLAEVDNVDLRFLQIAFEFEGFVYALLYIGERSGFDKNINIIRYMAEQLEIGQLIIGSIDTVRAQTHAIASDGENFLVVACENYGTPRLIGKIIRSDRTSSDGFFVANNVGTNGTECRTNKVAAIFDGTNYLIVYKDYLEDFNNQKIVGQRISIDGELIDQTSFLISQNEDQETDSAEPSIAFDGSRTLVTWIEASKFSGGSGNIEAAFVDQQGQVSPKFIVKEDLASVWPSQSIYSNLPYMTTQAAYANNQFLILWTPEYDEDFWNRPTEKLHIYGQILDLNGDLLLSDAISLRNDNGEVPRYPQISSNGMEFLVGWVEGALEDDTNSSIRARRVSFSGELLDGDADTSGIEIVNVSDENQSNPIRQNYLKMAYNKDHYLFAWTIGGINENEGTYAIQVTGDTTDISAPKAIPATGGDTKRGRFLNNHNYSLNLEHAENTGQTLLISNKVTDALIGWYISDYQYD